MRIAFCRGVGEEWAPKENLKENVFMRCFPVCGDE